MTTLYSTLLHTHTYNSPQSRLHCRCLVAASNGGRLPTSRLPNCPRPQLPASHSNSPQRLNPSSPLTSPLTLQPTDNWLTNWNKVKVTLGMAVYHQSAPLGTKSLEAYDLRYFLQLNPCGHSYYVTSSLRKGWICLLWIVWSFVKCTYLTYSMLLKILAFALYTCPLSV
jgi:hypothetical protein